MWVYFEHFPNFLWETCIYTTYTRVSGHKHIYIHIHETLWKAVIGLALWAIKIAYNQLMGNVQTPVASCRILTSHQGKMAMKSLFTVKFVSDDYTTLCSHFCIKCFSSL